MSEKGVFVERLDRVQGAVGPLLNSAGFRRRGRTFNRPMEDGVIHVVNFQSGEYPIGNYVIPGVRESFYGWFTVNLGIFVPCMFVVEHSPEEKDFYQEYQCDIRERLGQLADGKDTWWSLAEDADETAKLMLGLFEAHVFRFFERFRSYEDICAFYDEHGSLPSCNEGRSRLVVAIILNHLGRREAAYSLLRELVRTTEHVGFLDHVLEISNRLDFDLTHEEHAVDMSSPEVQKKLAFLRMLKDRGKRREGGR